MILFTYTVSGILLAISGFLFDQGLLNAVTQTGCWCLIFFLAPAGALSAYREIFPLELRGRPSPSFSPSRSWQAAWPHRRSSAR